MRPILLVEDNPDDRDLTMMALAESNIADPVQVARDGEEALDYLEDTGNELPVVVLLDLKLPRIGGLEVLKRMRARARTRTIPVVALTSSKEHADLQSSYENGLNAYVCKSVDFDQVAVVVRQLGLFWLVVNEAPPVPEGNGRA
jgi:two-component system, response regulator